MERLSFGTWPKSSGGSTIEAETPAVGGGVGVVGDKNRRVELDGETLPAAVKSCMAPSTRKVAVFPCRTLAH